MTTQPPYTDYNPTAYRDRHAGAVVILGALVSVVASLGVLWLLLLWRGFDDFRQTLALSCAVGLLPWAVIGLLFLAIAWEARRMYRADDRPHVLVVNAQPPAQAQDSEPRDFRLTVATSPRRGVIDGTARPAIAVARPPALPQRPPADRLPRPEASPADDRPQDSEPSEPAVIRFPTGVKPMPRLSQPDPETGRPDVPAQDVHYFIRKAQIPEDPGSPAIRKWLGHYMPSGKRVTRAYWEKLTAVAQEWGRLYVGTSGEAMYILPPKDDQKDAPTGTE